ncbi:VPLPA-CTERM sorting domain-containing protein [Paracoccus sp. 22332]|uniref:VPLPA-CTERM sorting domain-containing protein n=1 Tax=Paracoccus sp. 22332 TaxID=3453913 RepID=UPI003F85BA67
MFATTHAKQVALAAALVWAGASASQATTYTVFDDVAGGRADFDATATAAGGTVKVDTWTSLSSGTLIDRGDYTITRNNGGFLSSTTYGDLSGKVTDISPARNNGGSDVGVRTNPLDYFKSGVTLTFDTAINAIGFEVGDWATCCFDPVTELFISFDGGTPQTVASASTAADGLFPSQKTSSRSVNEIFVGAFDDTGSFKSISFWGNGLGEYLVFGGEVRYALIDEGGLPPVAPVPLPASALLLAGGAGALALVRRRRKAA